LVILKRAGWQFHPALGDSVVIAQLIRYRYLLIWARIRGRRSSFLIFGILVLLAVFLGLNSGFAGTVLGLLVVRGSTGAETIHAVFFILYAASIFLTIVLWAQPNPLLSEAALSRYPISPTTRFVARHIIGLLDPLWLTYIIFSAALFVILVFGHVVAPINALVCALLFISASYLSAAASLALFNRAALHPAGASLFGMVIFATFTTAAIAIPFMKFPARILSSGVLDFLPPAAAARLLLENSAIAFLCYGVILAAWCFLFAGVLRRMEACHPSISGNGPGKVETKMARFLSRLLSRFLGKAWPPLVERSLLYHLRCNRIRVNIGITIPVILFILHFMDRSQNPAEMLFIRAALLFVSGLISVSMMMFNAYAYDSGGITRLALYPVPFAATLHSANLASLVLSLTVGSAAASILSATARFPTDLRMLVIFVSAAWAGSFLLAALGLFSSVYFPKRAQFDRIVGSNSSLETQAIICIVMSLAFIAAIRLAAMFETSGPIQFWWAFPVLPALCICLYIASLKWISRLLTRRREDLLLKLCGA